MSKLYEGIVIYKVSGKIMQEVQIHIQTCVTKKKTLYIYMVSKLELTKVFPNFENSYSFFQIVPHTGSKFMTLQENWHLRPKTRFCDFIQFRLIRGCFFTWWQQKSRKLSKKVLKLRLKSQVCHL